MGEYQVRSWEGFHKHITLSFLSFYYVAYQKLKYEENLPLPIQCQSAPKVPGTPFPKGSLRGGEDSPKVHTARHPFGTGLPGRVLWALGRASPSDNHSGDPQTGSFNHHQPMGIFGYHNRPLHTTTGQVSLSNKTEFKTKLLNLTK